ncbi:MAG: hypothetical protein R6U96_14745 [Promethearchaeia archaeon]
MIFGEPSFQYFGYFDAIESGLYFVIVGYYFLLFAYFLLMRFRISKKLYWLFFSLLFLWLAAGRVFFIIYYFFVPEFNLSNVEIVNNLMLYYRLATFCTWMGISMIMGVLGVLLFPLEAEVGEKIDKEQNDKKFVLTSRRKLYIRIILIIIPIVVGILVLFIPSEFLMDPNFVTKYNIDIDLATIKIADWSYPVGRFVLNFILLPLLVTIIPIVYIYLAWKTFGVLRRSYALNAVGFLIYFTGRIGQGVLTTIGAVHTAAVLPPLFILLSLLILVLANNIEQLK